MQRYELSMQACLALLKRARAAVLFGRQEEGPAAVFGQACYLLLEIEAMLLSHCLDEELR